MLKNIPALLIPLLLGSFLVFSGWAAYQAATRVSDISDRDYYSKGLKYNSTLLEKRAAGVLGWELRSRYEQGYLIQQLIDKNGQPVSGAAGVLLIQPSREQQLAIPLIEEGGGIYTAKLPELTGEHLIRADFERDGARISRRILLSL